MYREAGAAWYVYHSERGPRDDETALVAFVTEDEACDRLYTLLTSGRMKRYTTETRNQ